MPVKTGTIASTDYKVSKELVSSMMEGTTQTVTIDDYKRVQKYVYEIGLKMKPRREFSTKKISNTELRVTRII